MKVPPVVYVAWRDSLTADPGWSDREQAKQDAGETLIEPLSAAGFLVADEPTHILITTGYNPHTDEVQGGLMIPRSEVVSLHELRPEE